MQFYDTVFKKSDRWLIIWSRRKQQWLSNVNIAAFEWVTNDFTYFDLAGFVPTVVKWEDEVLSYLLRHHFYTLQYIPYN